MPMFKCIECGKKKMSMKENVKYCSARCRERKSHRILMAKRRSKNATKSK